MLKTLLAIFFFVAATTLLVEAVVADSRPNIVFILVDDLGWKDLNCQGNDKLDTPHLNKLAAQGMRFTDAYAASPVCSPTRAAVLTGLSPARLKITNHIPDQERFLPDKPKLLPAEMLNNLPTERVTIAERLSDAGYATGFFGKWHLCGAGGKDGEGLIDYYPTKQGFDINVGGCAHGGPPSFFDPYRIHTLPDRKQGEYLPDRLADEVNSFIVKNQKKPFFVMLWNYAVHWPMEAPEKLVEKYKQRVGPGVKDPRYAAMTEALDTSIGSILAKLDELELSDNTLVIFTSDNGPFLGVNDAAPLRMGKGYLYEGGIRVPLIVRWPDKVKPGTESSEPVISMDFYPTILAATGLKQSEGEAIDGANLLPLLTGEGELKRKAIFFHYPNYAWHRGNRLGSAIRAGKYKLIERFDDNSVELYDLISDIGEAHDLAKELPDLAAKLQAELAAWRKDSDAEMPKPVKK